MFFFSFFSVAFRVTSLFRLPPPPLQCLCVGRFFWYLFRFTCSRSQEKESREKKKIGKRQLPNGDWLQGRASCLIEFGFAPSATYAEDSRVPPPPPFFSLSYPLFPLAISSLLLSFTIVLPTLQLFMLSIIHVRGGFVDIEIKTSSTEKKGKEAQRIREMLHVGGSTTESTLVGPYQYNIMSRRIRDAFPLVVDTSRFGWRFINPINFGLHVNVHMWNATIAIGWVMFLQTYLCVTIFKVRLSFGLGCNNKNEILRLCISRLCSYWHRCYTEIEYWFFNT